MKQQTLILVKPDGVQRGLIGQIIGRIEQKGLQVAAAKLIQLDQNTAEKHYIEHIGKPFFTGLVNFITSSPIMAMVIEGVNAVEVMRTTMGSTNPIEAAPGTIRGDYGLSIGLNLIHGSDSVDSAKREIALFFSKSEIIDYSRDVDKWITES
tara:strand:- start:3841 stop:4296 length:456 start_codon:yes stop_codon:yes gene_type:complete